MSNQSNGRKKSQFNAQTSVPSGAYFDFVYNGQNFRIIDTDLYSSLGVTGTIVQDGDPLGTPILDKAGSVNNIRNLEPGSGINVAVSVQNGAEISHNFTAGSVGVPVLIDTAEDSPVVRSISAGDGIQVTASGNQVVVATSDIPTSSNVIIVDSLDKLPTPTIINGVNTIRLEEFEYVQDVALSSPYPLAPPINGKQATWKQTNRVPWTYTGTDATFRDLDANGKLELDGLTQFEAPNGNHFDTAAVAGSYSIQASVTTKFTNCKALGTISGGPSGNCEANTFFGTFSNFCDGLVLDNCAFNEQNTMFVQGNNCAKLDYDGQSVNFTLGETVTGGTSGATGIVEIDTDNGVDGTLVLSSVAGVFQNNEALTGSITGVAVVNGVLQNTVNFTVQGTATTGLVTFKALSLFNGSNETVWDIKPEILAGVNNISLVGNMTESVLAGLAFAPGSLTTDDPEVVSSGNTFIPDSRPDGLLSMQANATPTVIASAGVGVLVAGIWVVEETSQMTGTTGGRLTYDVSDKSAKLPITASLTIEPVSGGTQSMGAMVAIDGVVVANSLRTSSASPGSPTSITIPWQEDFTNSKFVEVFVSNESGTTNVLVSSAIHRVN